MTWTCSYKMRTRWLRVLLFALLLCVISPLFYLSVLSFSRTGYGYKSLFVIGNPLWRAYANSLLICVVSLCGQLITSVLGGWGLAKYKFPGQRLVLFLCIVLMLLPVQVLLLPQYLLLRSLGVLDTLWAMILPGIFSPLGTVLLWRGFSAVPQETIEAAQGEGANLFVLLTKIALPMCKRELSVLLLISIAEEWNLLEQPMAYMKSSQNYPLSVYLSTAAIADTAQLLASCVLALLPIIVAFCLLSGSAISGERKGE